MTIPTPVALIYGKPPQVPMFPMHVTIPVAPGAYDWSDVRSSPLSIACPAMGTVLPTQWSAANRDANNAVTAVQLVAMVTPTQMLAYESPNQSHSGLAVVPVTTLPNDFALDQHLVDPDDGLFVKGIRWTVKGADATYQATILPDLLTLQVGPVSARALFSHKVAQLEPGDHDLPNFGWVEGYLTAYTDLPYVRMDILWHMGEVEDESDPLPITAAYHDEVTTVLPKGWSVVPLSRNPNFVQFQSVSDGVTPIDWIKDPGATPYTTRGQWGWMRSFMIVLDPMARTYAPLRYNPGYFSAVAYDASTGMLNAKNLSLYKSVAHYPMPTIGKSLATAYKNSMSSFLTQRDLGVKHGSGNYSPLVGYRHPMWGWFGAESGGSGITFAELVGPALAGHESEFSYLQAFLEGIIDRQAGFTTINGEPIDAITWGGDPLAFTINQSAADTYSGKSPSWLSGPGDGLGYKAAWNAIPPTGTNGTPGTTGGGYADATKMEHTLYKNAQLDGQHFCRAIQAASRLAYGFGWPMAQRILVHWGMQMLLDEPDPSASTSYAFPGFETGYGSKVTRQHGWAAQAVALAFPFAAPTQKTSMTTWADRLITHLEKTALPNGGFCAWNHNKEYDDARLELGIVDPAGSPAVTQSYQEVIISQGLHRLAMVMPQFQERIRALVRKNISAWLTVYKAALPPTNDEVHYRIGVWQESGKGLAPVPNSTVLSFDQAKVLYVSLDREDKYYYQFGLFLAITYAETPVERAFVQIHIDALFGSSAQAKATIPTTKSYFENAEPLLAALQYGL